METTSNAEEVGLNNGQVEDHVKRVKHGEAVDPSVGHSGDWNCNACGHHNYKFRLSCQKCNSDRPHPGKHPGDWGCPKCSHHNFVSRQFCQKCNTHRGFAPNVATKQANIGKHPGDWLCNQCFDLNYASRPQCRKCNGPKAVFAIPTGKPGRPGDWTCPACGDHNYASRSSCRKCNVPKSEAAIPYQPSGPNLAPLAGQLQRGLLGFPPNDPYQQPPAQYQQQFPPPQHYSAPPLQQTIQQQLLLASGLPPHLAGALAGISGGGGGGHSSGGGRNGRPGDWDCPACNNHNYASRVTCKKCNVERTEESVQAFARKLQASTGNTSGFMNPNDWSCPHCADHNYASRTTCRKCQTPKPLMI